MFNHRLLRTAGALLGLTAIAALPACDFSGFLPGQGQTLTITPETPIFHAVGDEMELTALSEGHNVNVTWESSDTTIARVTSEGVLAGAGSGSARVTARSETGAEQSVRVRVDPIVDGLAVTAQSNPYSVGDKVEFQAWGVDRNGHPVISAHPTWSSSNQRVATVNRQGHMTAREGGTTTITARSHGHEAAKSVMVKDPREASSAPRAPSNLTATAIGTAIVLSWELNSSNADEVRVHRKEDADADWTRVSTRSGTSTAWIDENKRPGSAYQYMVKARNGVGTSDASNEVDVSVRSPESGEEPSRVAIVAGNTTLTAIGNTTRLSAQVLGESGAAFEGHDVRWSSDNHRVATVSSDGTVTARGAGRVRISATAECCEEATVTITVRQIIATVAVALASTTLAADQSTQAVATATDPNGHAVVNPAVTWSSSNNAVARVDRDGTVTGRDPGSADIRAEADGRSASAPLTVEERTVDDAPRPPAAFGNFPNEPSGFQIAVYHDVSCIPSKSNCPGLNGQGEWDSWGVNGNLEVINEAVPGLGTGHFLRTRFPESQVGGAAPYRMRGTFGGNQGNDQREIYVSMHMRIPTPTFEHHPVQTKIAYLPHGSRNNSNWGTFNLRHIHGEHRTGPGGGYISERSEGQIQFRESEDWGSTPTGQQNTNYYFPHQQWVHVEIFSRPADIDRSNGIVRVWFDGNLVVERTDVHNRFTRQTADGTTYNDRPHWEFHHVPVWGGTQREKSRDDFIDYAYYYVSGTPFDRLETPANFRVDAQGDRNVLSWRSESTRHDGFDVFRWKESEGHGSRSWKHIGTADASTTTYRDFFVDRGQRYHYHIRAVNTNGESLPTDTEAVTAR